MGGVGEQGLQNNLTDYKWSEGIDKFGNKKGKQNKNVKVLEFEKKALAFNYSEITFKL